MIRNGRIQAVETKTKRIRHSYQLVLYEAISYGKQASHSSRVLRIQDKEPLVRSASMCMLGTLYLSPGWWCTDKQRLLAQVASHGSRCKFQTPARRSPARHRRVCRRDNDGILHCSLFRLYRFPFTERTGRSPNCRDAGKLVVGMKRLVDQAGMRNVQPCRLWLCSVWVLHACIFCLIIVLCLHACGE